LKKGMEEGTENANFQPENATEEVIVPEQTETVNEPEQSESARPDELIDQLFESSAAVIETEIEKKDEEQEEIEKEDFSLLSKEQLIEKLSWLLENKPVSKLKNAVDLIKLCFYKILNAEQEQKKAAFIELGNNAEEFVKDQDAQEELFKGYLSRYKEYKVKQLQESEKEKQTNLEKKYAIVSKISELINGTESLNKTFHEFRDLQDQWRDTGLVPQSEMKHLWVAYNHAVEKFYDFIKINKELRDLDFRKNMEAKIELCEKTEALLLEPMIIQAFRTLQTYHDKWKEIGPVPQEKREEIWERFKLATSGLNKKHQEYFDNLRNSQQNNLLSKTHLCEKLEEISVKDLDTPKKWEDVTKDIIEIQKVWKTIGPVPKSHNTQIFERYKKACDSFFAAKREFYGSVKEEESNNLQLKTDICMQAESMQDSTDWKKTTEDLIRLQKKWKQIGPVSRKHSDIVWKRFRAACDHFFSKKSEYFSTIDKVFEENLARKNELIEKVKNLDMTGEDREALKILQGYQKEWAEIGHVPFDKKDEIQDVFREALNEKFEKLKIDDEELGVIRFKNKIDGYNQQSKNKNKIILEQERLENKLKTFENDIITLENNIGFFSKSKNSEAIKKDFEEKIIQNRKKIEQLKSKLTIIYDILYKS